MPDEGHTTETERAHRRRSALEMSMDVLRALRNGERGPTQIMYKANLSWLVLRGLLDGFVAKGIVIETKVGGRAKYRITDKGASILHSYLMIINGVETASSAIIEPQQIGKEALF